MFLDRVRRTYIMEYRDDVRALFPHASNFMWNDKHIIAVPHGIEETMLLRNLGIEVPSPIAEHYQWTGWVKPFDVQIKTCELMTSHKRCYVLNKMGTGKTKSALWSFDYLRSVGQARKMLVVAPLSTLDFTWARECADTVPHLKVQVLTGKKERRLKRLALDADIYLLNHDGPGVLLQELRKRQDIDVICIDEAAFFRNRKGKPSIDMRWVVQGRKWVWAMTGSPCPNEPTDAYGLLFLVTPERAPGSWRQFRWETMEPTASKFRWVPKKGHAEIVAAYLKPSVCFKLDDVVELPEVIEREIDVGMGPIQRQKYMDLRQHALTQLSLGQVTAQNGGVLYVKLQQAACGYVYDDQHNINELDPIQRLDTIKDIIESKKDMDDPGKCIVFVPYIHMLAGVSRFLTREKLDHFVVSGATTLARRNEIFHKFQNENGRETLLAHPACMSHGLTLTAADTIVWASSIPSLEIFEQANARITRVGQRHKQQILMLYGSKTERETYRRLRMKRAVQDDILELLSEALT